MTDSLHENNPDKEFDELRFAVDDDGTNILIIINKGVQLKILFATGNPCVLG